MTSFKFLAALLATMLIANGYLT